MPVAVNSRFNPFTYDELVRPVHNMAQAHAQTQEQFNVMADNADQIAASLDPERDPEASQIYSNYMQNLGDAADLLMQNGVSGDTFQAVSGLRRSYMKDVAPIKPAIDARNEDIKNYVEAHRRNPNLLSEYDPRTSSVDSYMHGAVPNGVNVDGNDIINGAAKMAQAESTRRALHSENGKAFADTYWKIYNAYGYNSNEMQAFLDGAKDIPQFREIIDTVMETTGANQLTGANYDRAQKMALQGLMSGVTFRQDYDYKQVIQPVVSDPNNSISPFLSDTDLWNMPLGSMANPDQRTVVRQNAARDRNSKLIETPDGKLQTANMAVLSSRINELDQQPSKIGNYSIGDYRRALGDAAAELEGKVPEIAKELRMSEDYLRNQLTNISSGVQDMTTNMKVVQMFNDILEKDGYRINPSDNKVLIKMGNEIRKYNKDNQTLQSDLENAGKSLLDMNAPVSAQRTVLEAYNGNSENPGYVENLSYGLQSSAKILDYNETAAYGLEEKHFKPLVDGIQRDVKTGTADVWEFTDRGMVKVGGKSQRKTDFEKAFNDARFGILTLPQSNSDRRGSEIRFGVINGSFAGTTNEASLKTIENSLNQFKSDVMDFDSERFTQIVDAARKNINTPVEMRYDIGGTPARITYYFDNSGILHKNIQFYESRNGQPSLAKFDLDITDMAKVSVVQEVEDRILSYASEIVLPLYMKKKSK